MTIDRAPKGAAGSAVGRRGPWSPDRPGPHPFFTIGHSTRPFEVFVGLLREAEVSLVIDVRTVPRSRANPQYGQERLSASLHEVGLAYEPHPRLGGWRGKATSEEASPNTYWRLKSFRNYADYAMSPVFAAGLDDLRRAGHARRCAIMCAEAVWWRCHRRIIADYLIVSGEQVRHILGPGHITPAELTPVARVCRAGALVYPAASVAHASPLNAQPAPG